MIDSSVRAVFFDAVGTLLFPARPVSRTYVEAARRHGSALSEDEIHQRFRTAWARQERLDREAAWRTDEDREKARWRSIVAEAIPDVPADRSFPDLWAQFARPEAWAVHADVPAISADLAARGLTLGIGSNFDARLIHLVEGLPALWAVRGRCVVSSLVGWRKPAREFFAALTAAASCEPGRVLYVGDDPGNDLDGASAAGLRAILYDPEDRYPDHLRIRQLRDLLPG